MIFREMDKLTQFLLIIFNLAVLLMAAQQSRKALPFSEVFLYLAIASLAAVATGRAVPWLKTHWRIATAAAVVLCLLWLGRLYQEGKRNEAARAALLSRRADERSQASKFGFVPDVPPQNGDNRQPAPASGHKVGGLTFLDDDLAAPVQPDSANPPPSMGEAAVSKESPRTRVVPNPEFLRYADKLRDSALVPLAPRVLVTPARRR